MAWLLLVAAGVLEVVWAYAMTLSGMAAVRHLFSQRTRSLTVMVKTSRLLPAQA